MTDPNLTKMKIEIWSDIVCPWCYIGKRRFEEAYENFEHKAFIDVKYKSYQLDPQMQTDTSISVTQYLADKKGIPMDQAEQMAINVSGVAATLGLNYDFDNAIPINTLKAHGLLHYAKTEGKQIELKERLMKAYFIEAQNCDDTETLIRLAGNVGLDTTRAKQVMESNEFGKEVQGDISEAVQLGLRGVPFFVFDRKYGISGAQAAETFTETLEKAYADWRKDNPIQKLEIIEGEVCEPGGVCE
jgi:predicted DsbA family dithiol-disulfide isomerase